MLGAVIPVIAAVLVWWSSTGLLIVLVGRGPEVRRWAAIGLTVITLGATVAVLALREEASIVGAYLGFALGIALWAWHEAMLLFGYISGPRQMECPPDLKGWDRFKTSLQVILHHELGIALHAAVILLLSFGAANQVAAATYVLLWGMRISAKLLIFLGARNVSDAFLPAHLKYLSTYFNTARTTRFVPVFLVVTSSVAVVLLTLGFRQAVGSYDATVFLLLGTLALLAAFEHLALIVPLHEERLWSWALPKRDEPDEEERRDKLEFSKT